MMAQQEELGDLKLYRIPEPVTVAARSQKQVALLAREGVKVETVHRVDVYAPGPGGLRVNRILTTRNTRAEGLGLPLPAGRVVLFGTGHARPILLGQGSVDDHAVGEEVEIVVGAATSVQAQAVRISSGPDQAGEWELSVSNARPAPVRFEAQLHEGGMKLTSNTALGRRDGRPLWSVTIPANGRATLRYRLGKP
jgi:hypothetical protein